MSALLFGLSTPVAPSRFVGYRLALRAYPDAQITSRAFVPMAMLSLGFTVIGILLLNHPMGMRHGM